MTSLFKITNQFINSVLFQNLRKGLDRVQDLNRKSSLP